MGNMLIDKAASKELWLSTFFKKNEQCEFEKK